MGDSDHVSKFHVVAILDEKIINAMSSHKHLAKVEEFLMTSNCNRYVNTIFSFVK